MKPEKVFRVGCVSASVFVNEIETESGKRQIRNVNLQRRYKDKEDDEWKSSSSFGLGDMPQAIEVLRLAFAFVAEKEAGIST